MSKQTAIRLPDEIDSRLKSLAQRTGRTVSFYMREAIETHLDDMEDAYLAERALEEIKRGKDTVISSDEFWDAVEN